MTDDINLPELPDPYWWDAYTADQVREAQLAAVIADRSQALTKVPDGIDPSHPAFVAGFKMGHTAGQQRGLADRAQRQAVPQGWKPIETAPSDVCVLLYTPQLHETNPECIEARVYHDSRAGSRHAWATHWMPLPTPPASTLGAPSCLHDDTERLGAIWTRCNQCDRQWADDDPKNPFRGVMAKNTAPDNPYLPANENKEGQRG